MSDAEPPAAAPTALDLERLEAILERQVEEVAYESTLRSLTNVLPDSLARFLAATGADDVARS
jgi:hypothetical protein